MNALIALRNLVKLKMDEKINTFISTFVLLFVLRLVGFELSIILFGPILAQLSYFLTTIFLSERYFHFYSNLPALYHLNLNITRINYSQVLHISI